MPCRKIGLFLLMERYHRDEMLSKDQLNSVRLFPICLKLLYKTIFMCYDFLVPFIFLLPALQSFLDLFFLEKTDQTYNKRIRFEWPALQQKVYNHFIRKAVYCDKAKKSLGIVLNHKLDLKK